MNSRKRIQNRSKVLAVACFTILSVVGIQTQISSSQASRDRCESDSEFAFVAAGEFVAGSDRAERDYGYHISAAADAPSAGAIAQTERQLREQGWFDSEAQLQKQGLPAFCISRNLVTNADYQAFVKATRHPAPGISEADYQKQGFLAHSYAEVKPYLWTGDEFPAGKAKEPVVLVSDEDAIAFAQWKGQQDQQAYRLPTALEWEKAARGTDGRYFPWGNDWRDEATNWGSKVGGTSAIAQFPLSRSVYGVEDMAGNVFEFTATRVGRAIVMKGCSWDDSPGFCRAAYQHNRPSGSRHILFGFRLVQE